MEAFRHEIILASLVIYMVLMVLMGLWAMGRIKSASDFFVANRSLGPIVIALAVFSSTLSGFGFVGGPGLVYSTGISSIWMASVAATGFAVSFFLISKRIRMIAELRDTVSLPDVVAARYNSEAARLLIAITIILGVLGYMATQILAMALVLQSVLGATDAFAQITLVSTVVISSAVLIFYCVTGGIIASVYTDVVQGFIMMLAGVLVVVTAASVFDGGFTEASQIIMEDDPEAIMPFGTFGVMASLAWFFLFGMGGAGQPHVITKMMMNKNISDNRTIYPMTIVSYIFAAALWLAIGVIMRAVVISGSGDPLVASDAAAAEFLSMFAHPVLAGIVFAGLFAAIMSTADAFLNIGAAAIVHDIPKALTGKPMTNELFKARVATVVLSVVAAIFALYSYYENDRLVGLLGAFGWGTFAAAIVPVVVIGLNWKRATARAAVISITVSLIINLSIELFSISIPYSISGGFLALLTSLTLFVGLSLMQKPDELATDIEEIMDL
jgi:sodium/proline symporter